MNKLNDSPSLAVICDPYGVIQHVLRDDLDLISRHGDHPPFATLAESDNFQKAVRFLEKLEEKGAVSGWELVISGKDQFHTFYFSGGKLKEDLLIVGSTVFSGLEHLFEEMLRISNRQANQIREQAKEQALTAFQRSRDEQIFNDISQLNNELVTTQRELAKKNLEVERLYHQEQRRTRELNALYQAVTTLLSTLELDSLLEDILEAALSALPQAEKGLLILNTPSGDKPAIKAARGWEEQPEIEQILSVSAQQINQANQQKTPFIVEHISSIGGLEDEGENDPQWSGLIIPLTISETAAGDLILYSKKAHFVKQADLKLWQAFGATASAALQNALLHERIQQLALTDPLTGIHNRRGFKLLASQQIKQAQRYSHPLTLLMLDLDHFKRVNDSYGHQAGDQVLSEIAHRLSEELRAADLLARYGGEEFIILLSNTSKEEGKVTAQRLLERAREAPVTTDAGDIKITISIGLTSGRDALDLDSLIGEADQALYRAKEAGRDQLQT